jgi:hypothetical protein
LIYPRLRFGDGGTLDLEPVEDFEAEAVEAEWRAVHVKVEWLRSPKGRLDRALFAEVDDEGNIVIDSPTNPIRG